MDCYRFGVAVIDCRSMEVRIEGDENMKKWGKIGAPHSAKRKRFLASVRRNRKRRK